MVNSGAKSKKEKEAVHTIIFSYLSSLAGVSISSSASLTNIDMCEQLGAAALDALENAPQKGDLRSSVFKSMPDKSWPTGFVEYVTDMHAIDPSEAWCAEKSITLFTIERKRKIFFGSKVKAAFDSAKRMINNHFNVLWNALPRTIPSGVSKAHLLLWVRTKIWPKYALDIASVAVRQRYTRENKKSNAKYVVAEHTEEVNEVASKKEFKASWFPPCWLTFVYLGLPCGEARKHFISGSVALLNATAEVRQIRDFQGMAKANRRAVDSLLESEPRKRQNSSSSPVVVSISRTSDEIMLCKERVDCLRRLNRPHSEIIAAEEALLDALNKHLSK